VNQNVHRVIVPGTDAHFSEQRNRIDFRLHGFGFLNFRPDSFPCGHVSLS
jgi:hypothetical protein